MKVTRTIIFFCSITFLFAEYCLAQKAEEHFRIGTEYLEEKLIDNAIAEFKKVLPLLKEDNSKMKAETFVSLANAYNWKGLYKAAIAACKKAIEIAPDLPYAHYNMGFSYREEGMDKQAEKEFARYNELLKQQGEYIEMPDKTITEKMTQFVSLGDKYFKEGKLDDAETQYKNALEINPRNDIMNKLGQVYQQKRILGKSADKGKKIATQSHTDRKEEKGNVRNTSMQKEKPEGPAPIVKKTSPNRHTIKGIDYYNKGMLDEASEEFKKALELAPNDAEVHYNLGDVYADQEIYDKARAAYKKVIEINPEFIDAYLNLGMIYLSMDLLEEEVSLYKQGLKFNPDDPDLHFHLGESYAFENKFKMAIVEYKKSISLNPMYPGAQYSLAETYQKTRKFDLALVHAKKAEELGYPVDREFLDSLK